MCKILDAINIKTVKDNNEITSSRSFSNYCLSAFILEKCIIILNFVLKTLLWILSYHH